MKELLKFCQLLILYSVCIKFGLVFSILCRNSKAVLLDFFFITRTVNHWEIEIFKLTHKLSEVEIYVTSTSTLLNLSVPIESHSVILFHTSKAWVYFVKWPEIEVADTCYEATVPVKKVYADAANEELQVVFFEDKDQVERKTAFFRDLANSQPRKLDHLIKLDVVIEKHFT